MIAKGIISMYDKETYRDAPTPLKPLNDKRVTFTDEQDKVYKELYNSLDKNSVYLLHGITGSGKTEIYLNLIEEVIKKGKEAIVLVPEISLTPMMVNRFKSRFGEDVAIFHSELSNNMRYDEWRKVLRKEVKIVVGARSAIFVPFSNLGIIIIDEEHEQSYKQDNSPIYHARNVAEWRAKRHNSMLLLGSATPSIESYARARKGVSQKALAEMAGVNPCMISFWENGKLICRDKVKLQMMADFLGVSYGWLAHGELVSTERAEPKPEQKVHPKLAEMPAPAGRNDNEPLPTVKLATLQKKLTEEFRKANELPVKKEAAEPITAVVYKAEDGRRLDDINMIIKHLRDMKVTKEEKQRLHKTLSHFRTQLESVVLFGE
jgi:transcriptional regulator with XRE-family HTH domain